MLGKNHVPRDPWSAFLYTLPVDSRHRRLACGALVVSLLFFLCAAPFAQYALPQVPAFIPIYQSALIINDLITAVLLLSQYNFLRVQALLALIAGYLFCAFMAMAHALSFPGLFSPTGAMGAGPQTTAWLYFIWHAGFPVFILLYLSLKKQPVAWADASRLPAQTVRVQVLGVIAMAFLLCMGAVLLTTTFQDRKSVV